MRKVITEILKLMWKAFRLVFWKWIRPMLGKIILIGVICLAVITTLVVLAASSCSGSREHNGCKKRSAIDPTSIPAPSGAEIQSIHATPLAEAA